MNRAKLAARVDILHRLLVREPGRVLDSEIAAEIVLLVAAAEEVMPEAVETARRLIKQEART